MMKDYVVGKLLSGRLWLTLTTAFVFGYVACKGIITPETTVTIIATVFVAYFNRNDRKGVQSGNGNGNGNGG